MNFKLISKCTMVWVMVVMGAIAAKADAQKLPTRTSPKPYVSKHVPHVQVGIEPIPEISKELLRRVSNMPGIELRDTVMSMPGAMGFRIARNVELARPDLGLREREFGHMHPDGSLHVFLSPERAVAAVEAGWAAHHPYAKKWPKFKGFVMIFTPMSRSELQIVLQLVREAYGFLTTQS